MSRQRVRFSSALTCVRGMLRSQDQRLEFGRPRSVLGLACGLKEPRVADLLEKAVSADRESKQVEFKGAFDPSSAGDWCEVIKDIVAIANSGGGVVVFGMNDNGTRSGMAVAPICSLDLADIANKVTKYTGWVDPQIELREIGRGGSKFPAFLIGSAGFPLAFERPGTYQIEGGKQKTAFGIGTVYFRHGAKSEPASSSDIRSSFDRQLSTIRQAWLRNVKRVSKAPLGSQVLVASGAVARGVPGSALVRVVDNPSATPVVLTRDESKAGATFVHEEVSEAIFDEINNVVDANRILSKGQKKFFLGQQVYYRVYAERRYVKQDQGEIGKLFHAGACEFYAPNLFWTTEMSDALIAETFQAIYCAPKSPQIHWFVRAALLLGHEFCSWLYDRWHKKWHRYSQPPSFYFSFHKALDAMSRSDLRLQAARLSPVATIAVPGEPEIPASKLLDDSQKAERVLSSACIAVFSGNAGVRSAARGLDFLAHGLDLMRRRKAVAEAVKTAIGDQAPGDPDHQAKRPESPADEV